MRSLLENIASAIFAIILALLVWMAAVNEQNPMQSGTFGEPIPVAIVNKPQGLDFVNPSQITEYVQVSIRAPRSAWNALKGTDFRAVVDLTGLKAGTHDVPITVKCSDSSVRVEAVQPATINIRLEQVLEKVFEVRVRIMDDPALGYEALTPAVEPPTVKVIGPASRVAQVQSVVADVYLRRTKTSVQRDVVVSPRDAQDNPVALLTAIDPPQVSVKVPVEQKLGYRDVSVSVIRKGQVARGYRITGISVDPSIVTIVGSPLAVSQLPGYVETLPLDITGATADIKARIGLVLPEGVSILGDQTVSVTVSVSPIIDSITIQRPVSIQGLHLGYTAQPSPATVDVILSGPLPKLETLTLEEVRVVVDLFGLGPGVHKVVAQAFAPEGLTVESILPDTIEVEIKAPVGLVTATPTRRAPTPTPTPTRRP